MENGRIVGVTAKVGPDKVLETYRAPITIACDGVSARLAISQGINKRDDRPMGVAVRRYYESPRHDDDMLESWLELRTPTGDLLPGYGWVFGVGDGTSNVGLGILNTTKAWQDTNYKDLMARWTASMPAEWQYDEEHARGPIRGAALPMGFNRQPHYRDGMLLVGDAAGAVNPFNGEGIAYALESGRLAAEVVAQALARPEGLARERALRGLPRGHEGDVRRLLHARPGVRVPHRQPAGDEGRHEVRPAPSAAHEVHAEAAGEPHRPARRRRPRPRHQRSGQGRARGLTRLPPNHGPSPEGSTQVLNYYVPVLVLAVLAFGFAAFSVGAASLTGPKRYNRAKYDAYECGIEPTPQPMGGGRFPIKFYLTAMLFIVFDIEIVFLYPWAVAFNRLGAFGLVEMFLFIATVFVAYAYVWRRGGLEWD